MQLTYFHFDPTIPLSFANEVFIAVMRDPIELLEMHIQDKLRLMVPEIIIPKEKENSDHDEELPLADISFSDSGSDSN